MTPNENRERERERERDQRDRGMGKDAPARRDDNEAVPEFERGTDLDRNQQDPVRESER